MGILYNHCGRWFWWCRPALYEFAHFEPAGVDGRSFFFGASSGEGGLQMELGFLLTVKRGDVDSLQSPMNVLVSVDDETLHVAVKKPYHTSRLIDTRWRRHLEDIAYAIPDT